ncbi:MAG: hypothetical protein B9S32_03830 [Verrucomicrobia bacterium Tous-C9LFEB]|nr:MAG: hypothetical protein B9S32_03830 [Verrucomicrobia bacterium Tous-C9LFEB]
MHNKDSVVTIQSIEGYLFRAEGGIPVCRGGLLLIVFVPQRLLLLASDEYQLDRLGFRLEYWPERNCSSNLTGHGSHLWPDLTRPLDKTELESEVAIQFIYEMHWRLTSI